MSNSTQGNPAPAPAYEPLAPTEYMLLFRSSGWERNLGQEEMERIMEETLGWFEQLRQQGKFKAAQPLFEEGKIVQGKGGTSITDGPFAESKEAIGGYLILHVTDEDEAVRIARTWPLLQCGASLEVRPVARECPAFHRLRAELAAAS